MKKKTIFIFGILILCYGLTCWMAIRFGSVYLSASEVVEGFRDVSSIAGKILQRLRIPRVLGAMLSGAALSVSGLLLQSVTGNDLASPNVLGLNAGSGLGVMLLLCFAPYAFSYLSLAAFLGGLIAVLIVLGIAETSSGHNRKASMILSGVAVAALLNAVISYLSQRFPDMVPSYMYFSMGGFHGVYMKDIAVPAVLILIGLLIGAILTPRLNLLSLGEEIAAGLGVRVRLLRIGALVLSAILCGASVSYAGLLGFVGLVIPHMTRKLLGSDLRKLLPGCILLGGILVMLSDLVGRWFFAPAEISAGVFLSMIGAPFFIFLLYRRRRQ